MTIAIDYDGTYTADPALWCRFIAEAEAAGHRVYIVTCRRDTDENREEVCVECLPKYRHLFTSLAAKQWYCQQRGISIDVWIDDEPETISRGR